MVKSPQSRPSQLNFMLPISGRLASARAAEDRSGRDRLMKDLDGTGLRDPRKK